MKLGYFHIMENHISGFKINELDLQHHGEKTKHDADGKESKFRNGMCSTSLMPI